MACERGLRGQDNAQADHVREVQIADEEGKNQREKPELSHSENLKPSLEL